MSASWFSVSKATLTYILTKLKTVFDTKAEKSFVDIDVYGVFNSVGELDKTTKQATISADSTSDKLEVRPGDAVFFVASAANDSLTISSYDTHYKIVKGTGSSSNQFTLMSADAETDYEEWYTEGTFSLSKSDIGLSNVGNFKAVSTLASQGLSETEKSNARANIGAGTSNFSGSYNDLSNIPSSFTPSSHTHGNIQNGGTLQTNDVAIANGDKLVITDSSDSSKIARASIAFDGSTTTKYLSQKGTWESLTKAMVTTALGYTPPTSDTNTTYTLAAGTGDDANKLIFTPSSGSATKLTVPYASNAGTVNGKTVAANVPADAVFTDHTYNFNGTAFTSNNSNGQDANNVTYNAHTYYTSNGPATSLGATTNDGALYTQAYSTIWVVQIAQDYRNGRLFVRSKNNGAWQSWARVALTGESQPASDVYAWAKASSKPSYAWSEITGKPSSFTPSSHTHGNIQNGGTLQTNDIAIANGDKLVVTDSSDSSKIARASISFDGSTATKCLTQKGTWATFASTDTLNTVGATINNDKLYLIGTMVQAPNPISYSQRGCYVQDGKLYSNSKEVVTLSDSQALTGKTYNGYTLGAACEKGVATKIRDGLKGLVASQTVYSYLNSNYKKVVWTSSPTVDQLKTAIAGLFVLNNGTSFSSSLFVQSGGQAQGVIDVNRTMHYTTITWNATNGTLTYGGSFITPNLAICLLFF